MNTLEPIRDEKARITEWVRAAQARDAEAFGRLVEHYERAVFAMALRRVRNYAEAQELCQEVFVQALEKIHQLRKPECFGGWLRTITSRMAINRAVRRPGDVPVEPVTLESTCIDADTPLKNVLEAERKTQVREGLGRLKELDRRTLEAFYVQGRSLVEMSDEFDAPIGTIKRRLHVARKRLAKQVESLVAV